MDLVGKLMETFYTVTLNWPTTYTELQVKNACKNTDLKYNILSEYFVKQMENEHNVPY